jgi:hypothetical protein
LGPAGEIRYATNSRSFPTPSTGRITVKVISHYGDEVIRVIDVDPVSR